MICEKCNKNPASVHITKIVNGKKTELHLCSECAKSEQAMGDFLNPYGILKNIMDIESEFSPNAGTFLTQTQCPVCQQTLNDFERSGKVGCSNCYTVFRDELTPIIRRIHSSTQHVDDPTQTQPSTQKLSSSQEIAKLNARLKNAVAKEEYEEAAKLRDQINKLKAQKNGEMKEE